MSWWSRILGKQPPKPAEPATAQPAQPATAQPAQPPPAQPARPDMPRAAWLPADKNRFGIPVLDLISVTGKLLSTSSNPQNAAMACSWGSKLVADVELAMTSAAALPCELRYPVDGDLPDGWLFVPSKMEQKWAIGYRGGAIYLIRSWTGAVGAIAHTRRDGDELVVERLERPDDTLRMLGDPIETFDWIVRAHALEQAVPLPVSSDAAKMLEDTPLAVFSPYGHVATCAATSWLPPPAPRPLRSTSDLVTAVRLEDEARIRALAAGGASLDARSAVLGYTALHVAVVKGSLPLTRLLLELGADPNVLADRDMGALGLAVVHRAPIELVDLLAERGAVATPNADGFGFLHAIGETGHAEYLPWGLARGLDLEARTKHGHTPLHIAAALGYVEALRALLSAGADRTAKDPEGRTARHRQGREQARLDRSARRQVTVAVSSLARGVRD